MSYSPRDLQRAARHISEGLEDDLNQCGIFFRIFHRCKAISSLDSKLQLKKSDGSGKYDGTNKTLRDVIGVRINLYFVDDLEIVTKYLKEKYQSSFKEETIDLKQTTEFKPSRINLVFGLPGELEREFNEVVGDNRIDATYELQIRTVFSEGWHEVEHDLRYKCIGDWETHDTLARMFNGILASLETQEWAMLKIMDELSYKHYKASNASALLRTKLRVRTNDYMLSETVLALTDDNYLRQVFKLDRTSVINFLLRSSIRMPFVMDNLVYFINFFFINDKRVESITPAHLLKEFKAIALASH